MAVLAAPAAIAEGPAAPPVGRSYFDFLTSKKVGDTYVYDVPFPIAKLIEHLGKRAGGTTEIGKAVPAPIVIPNGRSLQKDSANLQHPRAIVAFPSHPLTSNEVGMPLRDRIFLGFAEKADQLEVISYNELAGRFEFQVVADYREGSTPRVLYADRAFCTECHQAEVPLFSDNPWQETNGVVPVYSALQKTHGEATKLFGFIPLRGPDPYPIDTSTDRAGRIPHLMTLWRKGCQNPGAAGESLSPEQCRAHLFLLGIARSNALGYTELGDVTYDRIVKIWRATLGPDDLRFYRNDVVNRNPAGFAESQLSSMSESAREALWIKNLINNVTIPPQEDPKLTPKEPYQFQLANDPAKESLDLLLELISGLVTPSERKVLPTSGAAFRDKLSTRIPALMAAAGTGFGDGPLRTGVVMSALLKTLEVTTVGGKPPVVHCCEDMDELAPLELDGGGVTESEGLATLNKHCYESCHGSFPGDLGFLKRGAETSDAALWIRIVKSQRASICERLDWQASSPAERMPAGPKRADWLAQEKATGTSARKEVIDAYRDELLRLAGDQESLTALGMSASQVQGMAAKCRWQPVSAQAQ